MLNTESQSSMQTLSNNSGESTRNPSPAGFDKRIRTDSQDLLQGGRELFIAHAGEEYRLRLTRNDKLILTK